MTCTGSNIGEKKPFYISFLKTRNCVGMGLKISHLNWSAFFKPLKADKTEIGKPKTNPTLIKTTQNLLSFP